MSKAIWILPAICLVSACAPAPESIQPSYVSDVPYQTWTCQQLGDEQLRLNNAIGTASVQQKAARSDDVAGVILLGLPVGSMAGKNLAPQIARYKGELGAVHRAMTGKNCPEPIQPPPATAPATPSVEKSDKV